MAEEFSLKVAEKQAEYGSFKDSMRAPIHRWFMYPAGYSYKLVQSKIIEYGLNSYSTILDPFVGCGTTSVVAKQMGINSIGIEAHPFVYWVAKVKLYWEYDLDALSSAIIYVQQKAAHSGLANALDKINGGEFPQLIGKCFSTTNLAKLLTLRLIIEESEVVEEIRDFLKLALTHTLRTVSTAGTGWPYIAPSEYHNKVVDRDAFKEFIAQANRMYQDIIAMRVSANPSMTSHSLILGDARAEHPSFAKGSVDLAITSPPYLNNYDYADRTRLETYFFGTMHSWKEISDLIRTKLIMSATTQINRNKYNGNELLSDELRAANEKVYNELRLKIGELSKVRLNKGGKKSYDILVAGYFNDIFKVLQQIHNVLKPGGHLVLVLGDSAPYGVYIPTDFYIGQLALGLGFEIFQVELLRHRGEKWANNPQRHNVPLRETIVTIER